MEDIMEIISKLLAGLVIGIILGAILGVITNLIHRINTYLINRKIKKRKREIALLELENLKLSYDLLMVCRTNYHKAKYIEDPEEKATKQTEFKALYEQQVEKLSNPDFVSNKEYLTETELNELEEVLSRPRYGLI